MPLAAIAAGGCFMGTEAIAQSQQDAKPKAAQSQQASTENLQGARAVLKQEGLSEQRIEKLSQDGFDRQEVERALLSNYKSQGVIEQEAQRQAREAARRVTSQSGAAYSQSSDNTSASGQEESREQSWVQQAAPEGAQVKDSATMVLNEEELNVQKRQVPIGGVVLRKKVTTEDASETVQLRSEDIEIVRLTPAEAKKRQSKEYAAGFDEAFQEGEIFIPLMREEAVPKKDVETRQVVRARPEAQTEKKQFDATLRKEQVEVQRIDAPRQQGDEAEAQESYSAKQQFDSLEDRIRSEIRSQVSSLDPKQIQQLDIQADQGVVTLSGSVPDEQAKQRIERIARSMSSVEEVQNELRAM